MGEGREEDMGQGIGALPSAALPPSGLSPAGAQAKPAAANALREIADAMHEATAGGMAWIDFSEAAEFKRRIRAIADQLDRPQVVVRRVEELPMVAFSERLPVRDDEFGEQTILTYSENVGVFNLEFFESGWEFPDKWLGASHWIDISGMWPGVTAQVSEWMEGCP